MAKTAKPLSAAYFCMEFGLSAAMKIYCGGLGILAGDYLKAAHDGRYPVVGIGLRWKQGYSRQIIGPDGRCYHAYRNHECPGLEDSGVVVAVTIRRRAIRCKVWRVTSCNNAPLYLLDTDLAGNPDNWTTGQLYGWFGEERIAQEMVLGIGGVRALQALGKHVDVYHFNEGHAAFAGLELIRQAMVGGQSFEDAWHGARQRIVFTTHTPVEAGNESHPLDRLLYMGADNGLTIEQLVAIGGAPFNMTAAGLRLARAANAVAALHAQTANRMWSGLANRAPIIPITNGIHVPSWVDPAMTAAARRGSDLWQPHQANKAALLEFVYRRTGKTLDPEVLTIGFARRIVEYKRNDLILRDRSFIGPLLRDGKLQIIFSGKSHPLDDEATLLIEKLVADCGRDPRRLVFLEDYDIEIGRLMTRGCDVWLNNPRRPNEACATSGMKAAMNGVLNLSTLDGWWPEACRHARNGWQFGDAFTHPNPAIHDAHDARALKQVLSREVIPTYYEHRPRWLAMMRRSIQSTSERFSAASMIERYYRELYRRPAERHEMTHR